MVYFDEDTVLYIVAHINNNRVGGMWMESSINDATETIIRLVQGSGTQLTEKEKEQIRSDREYQWDEGSYSIGIVCDTKVKAI